MIERPYDISVKKGSAWHRWKIRLEDSLRYNVPLRAAAAWLLAGWGCLSPNRRTRLYRWAESHRMAVGLKIFSPAGMWLRSWVTDPVQSRIWLEQRIGWDRYRIKGEGGVLKKSLVIRLPDKNAKGVIFVSFEYDLLALLSARNLNELLDRYRIFFAGSWSPPSYQVLWSFPLKYRHEFIACLSHPDDGERIRSLGFDVAILPVYMSSWQDPDDFEQRPWKERNVDIVMVANWAKFKRHWLLFDALRRMNRPNLRVVLIGQPESGRTVEDIRREAEVFGVAGQVEFLNRLTVQEVWSWLGRSRISLVFSRREGSCVVAAESLMAGTPVGLLTDAGIGSRAFIGPDTGRMLDEGADLANQLSSFLDAAESFSPALWAQEHISAEISREQLNEILFLSGNGEVIPFSCRGTLATKNPTNSSEWEAEMRNLVEKHGVMMNLQTIKNS